MTRCFTDAHSETSLFSFIESWICVIARLVSAVTISEKCKQVYTKASRVIEADIKGLGGDSVKKSLEMTSRDALGEALRR